LRSFWCRRPKGEASKTSRLTGEREGIHGHCECIAASDRVAKTFYNAVRDAARGDGE
jgi:hypothetical protein